MRKFIFYLLMLGVFFTLSGYAYAQNTLQSNHSQYLSEGKKMNSAVHEECPLIPFWAINGNPSREFLYERMKNWRSTGVTQLMIYARSGLEVEYMSEKWLDICEWICEHAVTLGFTSIWLYDEMNWPSGTCNGEVMRRNPDHALKVMCVKEIAPGKYDFIIQRVPEMIDLFNPAAVDSFIQLTHERYEKRLGKYFGKLIKGFFSDEPQFARFGKLELAGYIKMLPFYDGLEEDYQQSTGGELKADILRGLKINNDFWQSSCNQLYAKKFRKNFAEKLSNWCAQRNLLQTGHLLGENTSHLALKNNGHTLEVLSAFSLPGIDDIYTPLNNDQMEYLTYSTGMYAIEKQGSRGGIAELFAVRSCDITLEEVCAQFYLCAAFGIDRYIPGLTQTEVRGNVYKRNYFSPFSETQPWFPAFRELGECAKAAARWAGKERDCDVAVRYPYEPAPLADLLCLLAEEQLNWKLLLPGEATDAPLIFNCSAGGLQEERTGKFCFDFGIARKEILNGIKRKAAVYEHNGELARGVFFRSFKDDSVLVINLSGRERDLVLNLRGRKIPFHLYRHGVFAWDPALPPPSVPSGAMDLPQQGWQITLDSPNTMRADFENGICEFTLKDDLKNLKLVLRNYGDPVEVLLDGQKIPVSNPCNSLVQGFRELYLESAPFDLASGKHVLSLVKAAEDYPFLPSAFLTGNFAGDPEKNLSAYQNDGVGLYGYVGKITLKQQLKIPAGTTAIQANTLGLAAELALDGVPLGRRIVSPFSWNNPGKTGQVDVELTLYTSCARLFGEKAFNAPVFIHSWVKDSWPRNRKPLLFYSK